MYYDCNTRRKKLSLTALDSFKSQTINFQLYISTWRSLLVNLILNGDVIMLFHPCKQNRAGRRGSYYGVITVVSKSLITEMTSPWHHLIDTSHKQWCFLCSGHHRANWLMPTSAPGSVAISRSALYWAYRTKLLVKTSKFYKRLSVIQIHQCKTRK